MPRLVNSAFSNPTATLYMDCAAKTDEQGRLGINVKGHCVNVAEVARLLGEGLPASVLEKLPLPPALAAAVHDVGKVSPGFQLKLTNSPAAANFETDHARVGASAIWSRLGVVEPPAIADIVAAHHGAIRKNPCMSDVNTLFGGKSWSDERAKLIRELEDIYGKLSPADLPAPVRDCLAGLVTVADWIGSDERFFPAVGFPPGADAVSAANEAVAACGLTRTPIRPGLSFEQIFDYSPYPMQSLFAELATGPGLFILEAPMGMGKTEAALFAAYRLLAAGHHHGIFFGLPTRLTSDRVHERVGKFLARICPESEAKLAHGTAWLRAFRAGGEELRPGCSWFNPRKRSLLHPFVVGTIDQALLSAIRVKHYFVRSFALAGKVVILDEVHSYDGYTGTLMENMIESLLANGCSVIVLSATLTAERRQAILTVDPVSKPPPAYPLISRRGDATVEFFASEPPPSLRYGTSLRKLDDSAVAAEAVAKARAGHCVLAIANSVQRSQSWFSAVAAAMNQDEFPIGLLHSKFPACRRAELESEWMDKLGKSPGKRPNGCVLVATQVVEQSVDIDADFLITELAPTDMLLQRMGRQWRHPRDSRPSKAPQTLIIGGDPATAETAADIIESLGKVNCLVYAPYILWRSREVWRELSSVTLPDDIPGLLEATYDFQDDEPQAVRELRAIFERGRDKLINIANSRTAATSQSMPTLEDKEEVATRYSDLPTMQALIVRSVSSTGTAAEIILLDGATVKVDQFKPDIAVTAKLHDNLITIARHWLPMLGGGDQPAKYLEKHFHQNVPALSWDEASGELSLNGKSSGLFYSPRLGIVRGNDRGTRQGRSYFESEYDDFDVSNNNRFDW